MLISFPLSSLNPNPWELLGIDNFETKIDPSVERRNPNKQAASGSNGKWSLSFLFCYQIRFGTLSVLSLREVFKKKRKRKVLIFYEVGSGGLTVYSFVVWC